MWLVKNYFALAGESVFQVRQVSGMQVFTEIDDGRLNVPLGSGLA